MPKTDDLWSWSETFLENLEGLMREPPSDGPASVDWPGHRERLAWWRRQVDAARELYRQGHAEALRVLFEYWRTIADNVQEQVRVACETYRQLSFSVGA
jgi:hypothetical protein